jgi:hypothetical protein
MNDVGPTIEQLAELVKLMKSSGTWLAVDGKFKVPSVEDLVKIHERGLDIQSWLPISTAPKDGTTILVGSWDEQYHFRHQQRVHTGWRWRVAVVEWGENYPYGGFDWQLTETGDHAISAGVDGTPTMWQPLPAAPDEPKEEIV